MRHERTDKTEDVVKKGDRVKVKLIDRDERGRLRLSMKALLPRPEGMPEAEPREERAPRPERQGDGDNGGERPRREGGGRGRGPRGGGRDRAHRDDR
jgi:polyribonucleotide nucleotidyltransferase